MVSSQPESLMKSSGDEVEYGAWYQVTLHGVAEATATYALQPGTCSNLSEKRMNNRYRAVCAHSCRMMYWVCFAVRWVGDAVRSSASTPASSLKTDKQTITRNIETWILTAAIFRDEFSIT